MRIFMVLVLGMMIGSCIPKGFQGGYYYVTKPTEVEGFCWNPKRHSDAQSFANYKRE